MKPTLNTVQYAISQLASRAGCAVEYKDEYFLIANILVLYDRPEYPPPKEPCIIIIPCAKDSWEGLLNRTSNSLDWLPTKEIIPAHMKAPSTNSTPVLFWSEGCEDGRKPFVERREDGAIIFYADILAATFFMLSRWEETVAPIRDLHGRFPATASVAYKQGFLDRPVVDEYALILQAWLKALLPGWEPQPRRFSVKLSHDIDSVRRASLRTLAVDTLKRATIHQMGQTLQALFKPEMDPHLRDIYRLAEWSEEYGFQSAFYFMTARRSRYDTGYDLRSPLIQRCLAELQDRGHEVGFHPGYHTLDDPALFTTEQRRLDAVLGRQQRYGGRQHYLRFRTPDTWRQWEQAGLSYDSTLSYADHEGFRCGTCHPYQPFDIQQDRQLDLIEIPLIVMDVTLKEYRKFSPEESEKRILTLAQRCQQVNGVFTFLWHNSSLSGDWQPWVNMYRRVLPQLARLVSTGDKHQSVRRQR